MLHNQYFILIENVVTWGLILWSDTGLALTMKILKYLFALLLTIALTSTGCVSVKKSRIPDKKAQAACDLSHLGKNKYYYSKYYQRKLHRSFKKIKDKNRK